MQKTAVFFSPHPDDCEFGTPFAFISLLEQGYRVIEVLMTDGSFGTPDPRFKGKRLIRIRKKELENAIEVLQDSSHRTVELIRLDYTDGYLPLNKKTIHKISDIIQKLKPSIIFAPDPWYSKDYHPDHINTGRLAFFALKRLSIPIPLYYYYSCNPDRFVSVNPNNFKIFIQALSQHKSQVGPLVVKILKAAYLIIIGINSIRFKKIGVGYRLQEYDSTKTPKFPAKFESNFWQRIKYYIFHFPALKASEMLHNVSPADIGLEIKE
jgi:LmbE family N-acetylglucosaminyl deacetylase